MIRTAIISALLIIPTLSLAEDFSWAPVPPGIARGIKSSSKVSVFNDAISLTYDGKSIKVENKWTHASLDLGSVALRIVMRDGKSIVVPASTTSTRQGLAIQPTSTRMAERTRGLAVVTPFRIASLGLAGYWRLLLRDNSDYARIEVGFEPLEHSVDIKEIDLLRFKSSTGEVVGKVQGSPIVIGDFFMGLEHPMSQSTVTDGMVTCAIKRVLPIQANAIVTYSAAIGVATKGQMRRAFLAYVENERAHPYRPFLHYNSWYDIGFGNTFDEAQCLDRIDKFGQQLVVKRGVQMDSFLFDDGWDDTHSLWKFNAGFPHGFLPLKAEAEKFGAAPGVWLSPWGGYSRARTERLAYGRSQGMEVDSQGYALSGPKYYKVFHDVTLDFVKNQGINQFKFDGTGSPDKTTPGSQFDSDFAAAIALIGDLRKAKPGLFVNLTTGTWPSPFWLKFADSTWRGGYDHSFAGVGTKRQQWMTYRDADTYHGVVQKGPLYPLNSLMLHGIIYAQHADGLNNDPGDDFRDDVRVYFGDGTQLPEMYVTPDLLTSQNWDDLAEAAKWSRLNGDTLRDTHWVGGDPAKLEVYGWASWSPRMGILVLRNPSDKQQAFSVDIASVLEMPPGFAKSYTGRSPWKSDSGMASLEFPVGQSLVIDLKPFEVRVLNLEARK